MRKHRNRQAQGPAASAGTGKPVRAVEVTPKKTIVKTGLETQETAQHFTGKVWAVEHPDFNGNTMVSLRVDLDDGKRHKVLDFGIRKDRGVEYEVGDLLHADVGHHVKYTM